MTAVVMFCAVLVLGWFAIGSIWNVRKGTALMRWMRGGLPLVGERTTVRWLGTTSVDMVIQKASPPFEKASIVIFLEPRDVPWIWALSRRRGRLDTLIFRATLRKGPLADIEVLDRTSWSGRDAAKRMASERWSVREPAAQGGPAIFFKFDGSVALGEALLRLAQQAGMSVRRLSVRHGDPHLQLHVDLPALSTPAQEFFAALRAIGERAAPS
jgi:hypothetical protein